MDKIVAELSPEQLLKFNLSLEKMLHSKCSFELSESKYGVSARDAEIMRLKAEIFKNTDCVRKREAHEALIKAHDEYLDVLQAELGVDIQNADNRLCTLTGQVKKIQS